MINIPKYAVLHHTADSSSEPQLQKVNEYHRLKFRMRSRLGYWVGYHYFIERDGSLTQTRAQDEEGAHTKTRNLESIGIGLAGNFDIELPTEAQLNAVKTLIDNLSAAYEVANFPLHYHFQFSETHCPGYYFAGISWQILIKKYQLTFLKRVLAWLKTFLNL